MADLSQINAYNYNPEDVAATIPQSVMQPSVGQTTTQQQPQPNEFRDVMTQLKGMQAANDYLEKKNPTPINAPNPDSDTHGFHHSDKLVMIGSLFVGGMIGLGETGARAAQLITLAGEKIHVAPKGLSDAITEQFNRGEARTELYQNAIHLHPTITGIGKFMGGVVGTSAVLAALPVELIGGAVTAGAVGVAKGVSKVEDVLSEAKPAVEALKSSLEPATQSSIDSAIQSGAAKSIINAQRTGKAMSFAKSAGLGALIGETQYDPENNHYISQAVGGALLGLSMPFAGGLMRKLSTPMTQAIQNISNKYRISLPVFPKIEQATKYIFGSGYGKVIQERGQQVANIGVNLGATMAEPGKEVLGEQDLSTYLPKLLKKGYEDSKNKIADMERQISKNVQNAPAIQINGLMSTKDIQDVYKTFTPSDFEKFNSLKGFPQKQMAFLQSKFSFRNPVSATAKIAADINENEGKYITSFADKPLSIVTNDLLSTPQLTYDAMRMNRSRLGAAMESERDPAAKRQYARLYGAMTSDISDFLKQHSPESFDTFKSACKLYVDRVAPFNTSTYMPYRTDLKNADKFISKFIAPDSPNTLSEMISKTSNQGKAKLAVKSYIINKAMNDAHIEGVGINPEKFINGVQKYGKTLGVVFDKGEQDALNGYQQLVNVVKEINGKSVMPSVIQGLRTGGSEFSGWKIANLIGESGGIGYAIGAHHPALLPFLLAPHIFSRIVTSNAGRKLMSKIANTAGYLNEKNLPDIISKIGNIALAKTGASVGAYVGGNL